jgi:phosphoribosylanthranilate isomerase
VGVFVDESYDTVMRAVQTAGLRAVQLHGREAPILVDRLRANGLVVIKALFYNGAPAFKAIDQYAADAYLLECVGGPLPGGNALAWNWSKARNLSTTAPCILAGGLTPSNIATAIRDAEPDAVDVSSGVERHPGCKDLAKVRALCRAVGHTEINPPPRTVFT